MEQVTKKDFTGLHKAGKLQLVAACFNTTKEQLHTRLLNFAGVLPQKPTTRVDVANYGGYILRGIFSVQHNGHTFYLLQTRTDNSKCNTCSMSNIEFDTILYVAN